MNEFMVTELGFKMLNTERSVFMKVVNGERIICAIYVDDIVWLKPEPSAKNRVAGFSEAF